MAHAPRYLRICGAIILVLVSALLLHTVNLSESGEGTGRPPVLFTSTEAATVAGVAHAQNLLGGESGSGPSSGGGGSSHFTKIAQLDAPTSDEAAVAALEAQVLTLQKALTTDTLELDKVRRRSIACGTVHRRGTRARITV